MKKISILINTPHLHKRGGVSNHYKGLKGFWKQDVRYHTVGSRHGISGLLWMMPDTLLFVLKLAFIKPDIVLLNPSLQLNALKRDALYLKVSKYLKIPTCIFMHGWEVEVENAIDNKEFNFYEKYKKADAFLVLANDFKLKLKQWGVNAPIYLTTTKVDDKLIENLKISYDKTNKTILFLSRIEENKGI